MTRKLSPRVPPKCIGQIKEEPPRKNGDVQSLCRKKTRKTRITLSTWKMGFQMEVSDWSSDTDVSFKIKTEKWNHW